VALRIYDTLRREKSAFTPVKPDEVGVYVCGMTVQGPPHVGHARAALSGDVIRRFLESSGYRVRYVTNFTDVDDKIIERANEEGVTYREIAGRNIEAYFRVSDALHIRRADHYPRATEHIGEIVALIERLVAAGHAYPAGGDVYYRVETFSGYGKLSGRRLEEMRAGARIEPGEAKENPLDFALWKGAKPGEPSWPSPWGDGRPGWHIECSAMSMKYLGESFDLHGGGADLIFPHHENEIAQSEAATGRPFVSYWVHNGLVNLTGEKMSKSTLHFFLAEEVLREFDPETVRYYLLSTHYRSPIEFNRERLAEAGAALRRLKTALEAADRARETAGPAEPVRSEASDRARQGFREAMEDDFNSAKALGHLFDLARDLNKAAGEGAPAGEIAGMAAALRELAGILGVLWEGGEVEPEIPQEVTALAAAREEARTQRNWKKADELRDQILARGVLVEDRPEGPVLRWKPRG
jgi:cysteinyl-tRNA synthetase